MPPPPAPSTQTKDEQLLARTATALAHQNIDRLEVELGPGHTNNLFEDIQATALQYLHLDLSLPQVLLYTFQTTKTRPAVKDAYQLLNEQKQTEVIRHLRTQIAEFQTPAPQTPKHLPPTPDIEAATHRVSKARKQSALPSDNLVNHIATDISEFHGNTETNISEEYRKLARLIVESIKVSAALNTDPETIISQTLTVALAGYPQADKLITLLLTHHGQKLQDIYTFAQEYLIKATTSGPALTTNLKHTPQAQELKTIFTAAEKLDTPAFDLITQTASQNPAAHNDQSIIAQIHQLYELVGLTESLPSPHLTPPPPPAFQTQLAATETTTITETAVVTEAATAASTVAPPAILIAVAAPYLEQAVHKAENQPPASPPRSSLNLQSLASRSLSAIHLPRTLLRAAIGTAVGLVIGSFAGGPGAIIGGIAGGILGTVSSLTAGQVFSLALGVVATPMIVISNAVPLFIGRIERTDISKQIALLLMIIIAVVGIGSFVAYITDLSTFLQPLANSLYNNNLQPQSCQPSTSPFGIVPFSVTNGYRNNGVNCLPSYNSHTGVDLVSLPGLISSPFACNAEVVHASWDPNWSFGQYVALKSGDTYAFFAHMNSISVSVGDVIAPGTILGLMGGTGNATGYHLHYEIRQGSGVDPLDNCQAALAVNPCQGFGIQC